MASGNSWESFLRFLKGFPYKHFLDAYFENIIFERHSLLFPSGSGALGILGRGASLLPAPCTLGAPNAVGTAQRAARAAVQPAANPRPQVILAPPACIAAIDL